MKGLFALFCISLFVYGFSCCQSGWHYYSGSCFKVFGERTKWTTARSRCHHLGAQLAEDHSHGTHRFLVSLIKRDHSYASSSPIGDHKPIYYIGATDHNLDYDWEWESTGKVVYPEMFGKHQPDRYDGHAQECLAINVRDDWSESSNWDDVKCNSPLNMYICEMKDSGHSGSQLIG
ncbi:snaclec 4-like [Mytilus californianus]|uniref:snaclec 4-like n=1 Tax=Mytilus californianus TaxID=6549 RepID=UPI002247071D|nr:snaclec 4-like [Mytilus californianus]